VSVNAVETEVRKRVGQIRNPMLYPFELRALIPTIAAKAIVISSDLLL
jgi:hypothetical protein